MLSLNCCKRGVLPSSKMCDLGKQGLAHSLGNQLLGHLPHSQTEGTGRLPAQPAQHCAEWDFAVSCCRCKSWSCLRGDAKFMGRLGVFHFCSQVRLAELWKDVSFPVNGFTSSLSSLPSSLFFFVSLCPLINLVGNNTKLSSSSCCLQSCYEGSNIS